MLQKIQTAYKATPVQAKASLWALICGILQKGIAVITTPVFTRLLTPAEYGQYNVFNSWLSIITIFVSFNLTAGVFLQGLVKFESDRRAFSSTLQGLSLTLAVVWTGVYFAFNNFWNGLFGLTTVQMLAMLVEIWVTAVFNFWAAEQKNEYKYKALVAVTLTFAVLSPVTSIVFVLNSEDKVTARILGGVIIGFAVYLPLFIAQMKRGKRFFSARYWKYGLLFNLPLIPHYLAQVVLTSSDRIMIEHMVNDDKAGIYSLAYSLSMLMGVVTGALLQVLTPWGYRKIRDRQEKDLAPIAYLSMLGVAGLNLLLILFAPEAVRIFAPPEYYEAIWIIPPVAISVFYIYAYDWFAKFAFYYEKRFFTTIASSLAAVLNIVLNYVCINRFGYIAAGYTTLVCYVVYTAGHYIYMLRVCNKFCGGVRPYSLSILLAIALTSTALGLAALLTYNHLIIRYSILGAALVLCAAFSRRIIAAVKKLLDLRKE